MPSQSSQLTKPTWQCAQRWWNAVEAAGLGYYGAATEQLSSVMEDCQKLPSPDGYLLASLCLSSQASWQRQMGNHAIAATLDDKAIELLAQELPSEKGCMEVETAAYLRLLALADATSGRAADSLGKDVSSNARTFVDKGDEVLVALHEMSFPPEIETAVGEDPTNSMWGYCGLNTPRVVIRHAWVSTEVAIAEGRWEHAQACALQGAELSGEWFSARHHVKSLLIDAAAWSGTDTVAAVKKAERAYQEAQDEGFVPLQWAASMLIRDLAGDGSEEATRWDDTREELEKELVERGAAASLQ